ncbi:DUF1642 domain-containing protein [Pediococcus pentosaceus]|uniref:DUF1642 domain-containing protein n=1 Tax=Pediococcus pentosaceus TaxID=1255 RepID=UPI001C7D187C|nr:DUF1642 domain-containing protein [Pediococcus pentosaceus]QYY86118.1 DUF1642 domain-containing protein [Pediococcus pentosaceus]
MTKEELLKRLKKENESTVAKLNPTTMGTYARGMGYSDGLDYAVGLVEKLDEPKKVVIPQFVADWIENARIYYGDEVNLLGIVYWIRNYCADIELHYEWLKNIDNQKLLLNAIVNGYEVKKQKKYRVKIDSKLYFQRFENIEAVFVIDDSLGVKESSPVFTREVVNKILETLGVESGQLEEVQDD